MRSLLLSEIRAYEKKYHRVCDSVCLLVVSKGRSSEKIKKIYEQGQRAFGENYVQEAIKKQAQLKDLDIEWHYIGNIQSNKIKLIAAHFSWVHSVNRFTIAEKLNAHCASLNKKINVCIEVNIDESPTKSGVLPKTCETLVKKMQSLSHLQLRGLMVMPDRTDSQDQQYALFKKAVDLQKELKNAGFCLDTLSMGMSSDFEMAIKAGSTMLRIGTAIFSK